MFILYNMSFIHIIAVAVLSIVFIFIICKKTISEVLLHYTDPKRAEIIAYLNSLDVYVVSPGGVSSNYVNDYLKKKGLRVGESNELWGEELCHTKTPYTSKPKTLFIYGDWKNSLFSQHARSLSLTNINKIHGTTEQPLDYFINTYPNDPYGLKEQYENFVNHPNTWVLKYPYSKEELQDVIRSMGYTFDTSDIEIHQRKEDGHTFDHVIQIYNQNDPYS
jgi:hypothetical protein